MSFQYVCLQCNGTSHGPKADNITCQHCRKTAWPLRCYCRGQVDHRGQCEECGRYRS